MPANMFSLLKGPGFADAYEEGIKLGDLQRKSALEQQQVASDEAIRNSFQKNTTIGPDGTPILNKKAIVADSYKADAMKGMALDQKFTEQDAASRELLVKKRRDEAELISSELDGVQDQAGHTQFLAKMKDNKIDVGMGPVFDPNLKKAVQYKALSFKEKLEQQLKEREAARKDRELDIRGTEANLKRQDLLSKRAEAANNGTKLPLDSKEGVKTLATKNANKIAIKNQIDAVMGNWDSMPNDQKVAAGRQLIKTLNSTEGSDAVGAEESRRLGGKLEYAIGNLTNSNPIQFGRDLEGFKEQAGNVSKNIGKAVEFNQAEIDRLMGRSSQPTSPRRQPRNLTNFTPQDVGKLADHELDAMFRQLGGK